MSPGPPAVARASAPCYRLREILQGSTGAIETFMLEDHARVDRLLAASEKSSGAIDQLAFARFRHDLLRHIGMEEKVLMP